MHSQVYYQRLRIKSDVAGITKHSRAYCQHLRVKKRNMPGVTKKDTVKWQVLMVFLEKTLSNSKTYTETLKLCGTLVMKTMKKNAKEHNINKVMQKLTAAELHTDNEELFKKIVNEKT